MAKGREEDKPRPATLQDYWRRDPETGQVRTDEELEALGHLTRDPQGKLWHIVHMPTGWRVLPLQGGGRSEGPGGGQTPLSSPLAEGTGASPASAQTWKTSLDHPTWAQVEALVSARIATGRETSFGLTWAGDSDGNVVGSDRRAQFVGAILKDLAAHPTGIAVSIHACLHRALFRSVVSCSYRSFGHGVSFRFTIFYGDSWFEFVNFEGEAWFEGSRFVGVAGFKSAKFEGDARFQEARFAADAQFQNAQFATSGHFDNAVFAGNAIFEHSSFGEAQFQAVFFAEDAAFQNSRFESFAAFHRARFASYAWFTGAEFGWNPSFERASFAGWAGFESAYFSGRARFDNAGFLGPTSFRNAVLADGVKFSGSPKANEELAVTPILGSPGEDRVEKIGGQLETGASDFSVERCYFRDVDFSGAVFGGEADFSDRNFLAKTDFSGAVFGGLAKFHDARLHQDTNFTRADFREASFVPHLTDDLRTPTPDEILAQRDAHYAAYERAYRTLKLAMEGHRARREEARFYRLELEARRKRPARRILGSARAAAGDRATAAPSAYWSRPPGLSRDVEQNRKEVTAIEKGVSYLYGLTSGYGDSLLAPIGALAVLWFAFALIYGALAGVFLETPAPVCLAAAEGTTAVCPTLQTLMVFSGRHTFLPVVMTDQDQAKWWFEATRAAPLIPFLAEFVHRLASAVLIFLLALAIRRRFQIN